MSKKRKRLGQVDSVEWGRNLPEHLDKAFQVLDCHRCGGENNQPHMHHWSDPDKRLCVKCYNIVAEQHRPPSKRK